MHEFQNVFLTPIEAKKVVGRLTMPRISKRNKQIIILCSIGILVQCALALYSVFSVSTSILEWEPENTEHFLREIHHLVIPEDAVDIALKGYNLSGMISINLDFKAPPQSAGAFAAQVCDGILHQGYDPRNALNLIESRPSAYRIDMRHLDGRLDYYYHSFSPRSENTLYGNRCNFGNPSAGMRFIRLDKSNESLYEVGFDFNTYCVTKYGSIPCDSTYTFDTKPVADAPILIRGIKTWEILGAQACEPRFYPTCDGLYVSGKLCIDLDPTDTEQTAALIGANVEILLDGTAQTPAFVAVNGLLTPQNQESEGRYFSYCYQPSTPGNVWDDALHTMTLNFTTTTGTQQAYTWEFYTGENPNWKDE